VIDLTTPYPVTAEHVQRFDADGFIRLPQALAPDVVRSYEPEITAKVIERNTMHLPFQARSTFQRAFLQVMNLWRHSDRVRELVHSPRLARLAAELLGVQAVRLYHDQALYKEPGGGITPWHADQYYWPLDSDRTCTIWLPLQDTPLEMGPLSFAAGSHRLALGRDLPISSESEEQIQRALAEREVPVVQEPFRLGDASVHQGWTFHRAAANTTREPRRAMTIIYMDADIIVTEPNPAQRGDLEAWLPGAAVGAVPDTPLNPVLYSRSWPPPAGRLTPASPGRRANVQQDEGRESHSAPSATPSMR
jgi:Phytanoyl-CoA dioxygenase (PhyH)